MVKRETLVLILRIIELLLLLEAIGVFTNNYDGEREVTHGPTYFLIAYPWVHHPVMESACAYVIILGVLLLVKLINKVNLAEKLQGIFAIVGAILLWSTGIVIFQLYYRTKKDEVLPFVSGIVGFCAGIPLFIAAFKLFGWCSC